MRTNTEPLTAEELDEINRRRAEARERARIAADQMSDEEDAALTAAAEADPDNPPLTDEQWARMRPAHEIVPHLVAAQLRRGRGRPKAETPKEQVTLRLDPDVVRHFKGTGAGWRSLINKELRLLMKRRNRRQATTVKRPARSKQAG